MKKAFVPFVIVVYILLSGCNSDNTVKPVADFSPGDADTTESDIRGMRPKFLDFTPVKYHLVNTGDHNYIRILTNADDLQKVWIVYYDNHNKLWNTITWMGKGKDNTIIGDTLFKTIYGVVYPSGPIDDPSFYMAHSNDNGKTWQGYAIEKSILKCNAKGPHINHVAQILLSGDFAEKNGKPSIVVMIQSPVDIKLESSKATDSWDNGYLCSMMNEVKIKP